PAAPRVLVLAAGGAGLFRSTDRGIAWGRIDDGGAGAPVEVAGDATHLLVATAGDGVRVGNEQRDLSLTATAAPSPVLAGQTMTLTVGVANAGPSPATATHLDFSVPDGVAVRDATPSQGTCTIAPLACDLGTLAPGAVATVSITLRPTVAGSLPVGI